MNLSGQCARCEWAYATKVLHGRNQVADVVLCLYKRAEFPRAKNCPEFEEAPEEEEYDDAQRA